MRANSRLDAWVLPKNPNFIPEPKDVRAFILGLKHREDFPAGPLDEQELMGHGFFGGFAHMRVVEEDSVRFIANQQGGFRVFCGESNITAAFGTALTQWRTGGHRMLVCPACGDCHELNGLDFRPNAGFYSFAIHFSDVQRFELTGYALEACHRLLGSPKLVFRRIG